MAVQWVGDKVTANSAADLSPMLFRVGYLNSSGQIALATSSNQGLMGVITEPGKLGRQSTLTVEGIAKVACAAGTYAPGDKVQVDANGRVVAHAAPAAFPLTDVLGVVQVGGTALPVDALIQVKLVNTKN